MKPTCRQVAPLLTSMEEEVGSPENKQSDCFSNPIYIEENSNILTTDVLMKITTALRERNWVEVVSIVKDIKHQASRITLKIAVTGDSGNGMSSFINALRLIGHEEEESAPTGVVRTTLKPACYSSSTFPNVELWDLPGTGVLSQSTEDYLEEMEFDKYDLIIIIASEQFSLNHVKLAEAMQKLRRKFYVVWTKLDRDLSTTTFSEPELVQSIQKNIQENLQNEELKKIPIFLISSISPLLHDFPKLKDVLQKDLSTIRYCGLSETLFQSCEKTIDEKAESIKSSIDEDNLHKEFGNSDFNDLGECQKVFQEVFGVDDKSLQELAVTLGQPEAYYMDALQSQVIQIYQQGGWTGPWLNCFATQYLATCFNYVFSYSNPQYRIHMQQKHVLDEAAEKTKKILWKIVKDYINNSEYLHNSLPYIYP